ncbi:MAG TPA: CAP domain-containing protein [Candidatus Sulfotelmatobacter sp.]|nr:CAP domain-containing protein [Candidatus Sulfotelmatobacter sp.]
MSRTARLLFLLLLSLGAATLLATGGLMPFPARGQAQSLTLKPVAATAPDIPFSDEESQTEQQLLAFANDARRRAGVPPLRVDAGLSLAARAHAQAMLEARRLAHQFPGEPALSQRLAAATRLLLDQAAENVAFDYDAQHGHEHLMLSPPHRANLLNPAYNVVGLGVVRNVDRLYIVQDFGHALPNYSADEVKARIALAVQRRRRQVNRSQLSLKDLPNVDQAACSMAQADRLATSPIRNFAQRYTVLTYTSLRPEVLPRQALQPVSSRSLRSFSVGACYARTETYPNGVYWVVLSLD